MDTDEFGVQVEYLDNAERPARVPAATVELLHDAIGRAPADLLVPLVVHPGDPLPTGRVTLEDGGEADSFEPLPLGYHTLTGPDGRERRLIVSPGRCVDPPRHAFGWAVQLYSARSAGSGAMGDLSTLRWLSEWAAAGGAGFLLVNPLHAAAPVPIRQASPYFPSTRSFVDPIYLHVEGLPDPTGSMIDRDEIWARKREILRAEFKTTVTGADFAHWRSQQSVEAFSTWCALTEHLGADWREWPSQYRSVDGAGAFEEFGARDIEFYAWLQWRCRQQLAEATAALPVIQDLPIGVDPGGADAWMQQDVLAHGISVGAPPDPFNQAGQDWGLPPFVPWRLQQAGYQPFIDAICATMATGGGLRIDHVMGLFRLWWVPAGLSARDGGYVRYPAGDLLDIVALESHRAGAPVVGEDLGTVEDGVREELAERNMLSYRVLWFEDDAPVEWPTTAMAAVTTHDLPTVAGVWTGTDLADQRQHGVDADESATTALRERIGAPDDADVADAVASAYRRLAQAPSNLVVATLEDVMLDPHRPNMPGTTVASNWSRALPRPVESLADDPVASTLRDALRRDGG